MAIELNQLYSSPIMGFIERTVETNTGLPVPPLMERETFLPTPPSMQQTPSAMSCPRRSSIQAHFAAIPTPPLMQRAPVRHTAERRLSTNHWSTSSMGDDDSHSSYPSRRLRLRRRQASPSFSYASGESTVGSESGYLASMSSSSLSWSSLSSSSSGFESNLSWGFDADEVFDPLGGTMYHGGLDDDYVYGSSCLTPPAMERGN